MSAKREINLAPSAIGYVRDALADGLTLSKHMLAELDVSAGRVTTGVPEDANMEFIERFQYGGLLPPPPEAEWRRGVGKDGRGFIIMPQRSYTGYVVSTVRSFLEGATHRLCILENGVFRASDPFIQRGRPNVVTVQEEVYHLLVGSGHPDETVGRVIREAGFGFPPPVGALTSLPVGHPFFDEGHIASEDLRTMAARTEKIVVGAYDGEGYLIWHRAG